MKQDKYRILKDVFGFDRFRPGQEDVVDTVLSGRDVLAVMPTGSGKSLCFQVPALVRGGLTVVVSPLVALMEDQVNALRLAGVAAETINSAHDRSENVAAWRRVAAGDAPILYLAPERLMTPRMLEALGRLPLSLLAVDEAHCISQWGPAFRPEYEDLGRLRVLFPQVPLAAFTATADAITREDIAAKLFNGDARTFVAGFDRPNIKLAVEPKRDGKRQLLRFLENHAGGSGIVYCLSRRKTEDTAAFLCAQGLTALPYHAGMDKADRQRHQDRFMTEAGVIMVATIAFGMGIDKQDVRFVFHTDLPGSLEAYYQEIGRAGRDGTPAEAFMLYGLDDLRMRRLFIEQEDSGPDRKRREHKRLDALIGYCESPRCRRRVLLTYFGESPEPCGHCDVCLDPVDLRDGTVEAQAVLSAVTGSRQIYGTAHIIDILRGQSTDKVRKAGHDRLAIFGAAPTHGLNDWRSIVRQMVAAGFLDIDIAGFGGLRTTDASRDLETGTAVFEYRPETMRRKKTKKIKAAKAPAAAAGDLSAADQDLLADLKARRLELAQARGVPAYLIFPDRTLIELARHRPGDDMAFAEIRGVGAAKLEAFAADFIAVIRDHQA